MLPVAYQIAGILVGAMTLSGLIFLALRGDFYRRLAAQWEQVSEERKALTEVRTEKIADLERRIIHLEGQVKHLEEENEELRKLNLKYQKQIAKGA